MINHQGFSKEHIMKYILVIGFILTSIFSHAQDQNLARANKYFSRAFYSEAIPLYEKVLDESKSFEPVKNIADSYYYINDMVNASKHYKYLLKYYSKKVDESYYLKYANTLKARKKYNTAYKMLRAYYNKHDDEKLKMLEKNITYLENVEALGERYTVRNLEINTEDSEFGAIEKGYTIVFAAPKKDEGIHKRYRWNNQNYLDLYTISTSQTYYGDSVAIPFSEKINSKLHESNIVFTKDGKTAYFTRNNIVKGKRKKDAQNITHVQIYRTKFIGGEWKDITALPFNSDDYSTEHPALSPDEDILYFASDMPNGLGGFDLYSVVINKDGSFDIPENLGPTINTDKKEQFPYVSQDNKLYFSSNGHVGFGSLDVFVSHISEKGYSKPDNVGLPVNSGYDDFAFNINSETKKGFFASNRPEGKGSDDIYEIKEEKPLIIESCQQFISGIITDEDSGAVLANAQIVLEDADGKVLSTLETDANASFKFQVACQESYTVKASKSGYKSNQKTLVLNKERKKNNDASMTLKSLVILEKERREALALKQAKERELKRKEALKAEVNKKENLKEIIAKEKDIVKNKKGQLIVKTDEINFDYKLWYLRRDAKKAIDKVIGLMKKYPEMIVEVGTHSDIRGNNRYNLNLSQKRAGSVREYFMKNGIEPDRIFATGYGETKPLITCATEEACSEEQHELNRRCEFVVKKIL